MPHTRFRIFEKAYPYFMTSTIVAWLPVFIQNDEMMLQKLEYMHNDPLWRGYIEDPTHWRYSSARNYAGM